MYLFEWIIEHLKITFNMTMKDISGENSSPIEESVLE